MNQTRTVAYYLILSLFSVFLLLIIISFEFSDTNAISLNEKFLLGVVFIASSIFGISLALFPNWLKQFTKHGNVETKKLETQDTRRRFSGHHPDCHMFNNHRIEVGNKILCAGCLGLSIGSVLAIILMIFYIVILRENTINDAISMIIIGFGIIFIVFLEIALPIRNAIVHVISNISLVTSFFLVTIGIFEITGNIYIGLLAILFSFLWLDTRIRLSVWRHSTTCNNCDENCRMY